MRLRVEIEITNPYARSALSGKPFSRVFQHEPLETEGNRWRLRGSGVSSIPEQAVTTREVLRVCWEAGVAIEEDDSGSPAHCDSYKRKAEFLDGGLVAETGNSFGSMRGAWVTGVKAVYFLACALRIGVRPGWEKRNGLGSGGITYRDLMDQIKKEVASRPT
jgi:hypothetical protein